jgi:hypothetical protein
MRDKLLGWHVSKKACLTMHDKEIFVFVHAAKSAGSSFWRSLVKACQGNPDIGVADSYHESIARFGTENRQNDAACELYREFGRIRKSKLLLHYHSDEPGLHLLTPTMMPITFILLIRNEVDRLKSAYKWYLQTEVFSSVASTQEQSMAFFNTFLSKGYSSLLPGILGGNSAPQLSAAAPSVPRIALVTVDDYNNPNESAAMRSLVSLLDCDEPEPFVFPETVSRYHAIKAMIPAPDNYEFWDRVHICASQEVSYIRSLPLVNS